MKLRISLVYLFWWTGNAKEFLSSSFMFFMPNTRISHQTPCPYTPQQNGMVECKNRHLLEVTRNLLIDMDVHKHFWECSSYLINYMSSTVLDGQMSYFNLFSLPLRIFGCVCSVHDHSTNRIKLDPKTFKCVFLWCSRGQKE